jgi:glycerol-3-phosphate dehydrogenase (NAD(P)+)
MEKIAVIGTGSWGTALANTFADAGNEVTLWGRDAAVLDGINRMHENPKYLKGLPLNPKLVATRDLGALLAASPVIVNAIPTQQIRSVFTPYAAQLRAKLLINIAKGIELGTHFCVSDIFREIAPGARYLVLSGPSFAEEVMRKLPTAVTVASRDPQDATLVQRMVSAPYFRAYTAKDVVGVELAGSLKNVVAIASGMVSGLKLGYNAQAALINRGIAEMIRVGRRKGAEPLTYLGLAGMGDLLLTCTGPLSRNRRVGEWLGQGKAMEEIQRDVGGVAEGVFTARSAYELGRRHGVEMPITEQVYRILYEGSTPQKALGELMGRDLKEEWDMGTLGK